MKLLIARQFDFDDWSLSKMLEYLKKEIEAKERATLTCASYSQIRDQNYEGKYSLSALTTLQKKRNSKRVKDHASFVTCLITLHGDVLKFQIQ